MPLLSLVLAPFVFSVIIVFIPSLVRKWAAGIAGGVAFISFLQVSYLYFRIEQGEVVRYEAEWLPEYGLNFVLRMDGLAWLFAMLVLSIGVLISLYARYYMSPEDPVARFFSFILAFMGSMLGVVLSGNLIQLVIFWELTSLTSDRKSVV